jgi:plastocyanin
MSRLKQPAPGYIRASLIALATLILSCSSACILAADAASGPQEILINSFMFMPMQLTVRAGSTVTWINLDEEAHTIVSDTGLFRSGALDTNEKFAFRFENAGIYHFTCSIHPRMVGTVIVD